jgi:hypothetical protein
VLSMTTWVTPSASSQWRKRSSSAVMVPNSRVSARGPQLMVPP